MLMSFILNCVWFYYAYNVKITELKFWEKQNTIHRVSSYMTKF